MLPRTNGVAPRGECLHIITSEYPPQQGGVSDHSFALAKYMAAEGREVHVWCGHDSEPAPPQDHVYVHRVAGDFSPVSLRRLWKEMDAYPDGPVLVQWVPHGYGYRSLNVFFCLWLWARATFRPNPVDLLVHEAFLAFHEGNFRQDIAAAVHRLMTIIILRAPRRVWVSTTSWERLLRPYLLGRKLKFEPLPTPTNIPVNVDESRRTSIRAQYLKRPVWGHFGTYGANVICALEPILVELLGRTEGSVLLIGGGSDRFRSEFVGKYPQWRDRVLATGRMVADEISLHLSACDAMLQPYPDGVSCRRGTLAAALAHGKPVITNLGRSSESWWPGQDAVTLAKSVEADEFVKLCRILEQDEQRRAEQGAAAESLYRRMFSWNRTIEAFAGRGN